MNSQDIPRPEDNDAAPVQLPRQKEPQGIVFPTVEPEIEEVEYVVLKKEPQPLALPEKKYTQTKTLYVRLDKNKVPIPVIEWLMVHSSESDYDFNFDVFRSKTHVKINYLPKDDEQPPGDWQ